MIAEMVRSVHPEFVVLSDELMNIDIRPQDALSPVVDLPAAQNPARIYLASLDQGSHRTMIGALDLAAGVLTGQRCDHRSLPWWLLRVGHTRALQAWLRQNRSAATGNKVLSATRGTLRAAWEMNLMNTDEYMRAVTVKNIRAEKPEQATGRAIMPGEFSALLRVCMADSSPAGARDAAILGLGLLGGLRRAEIAGLLLADYEQADQRLHVKGKRNKERKVPVAVGVAGALADWLHVRGAAPGPLFVAILKSGQITGDGLSTAAIWKMLQKRTKEAGVKPFSPHDMRRTFAGDLLDAGADIVTVQKLLGHANANTTAGYDRRGDRAKREAISRLHMAWERRYPG